MKGKCKKRYDGNGVLLKKCQFCFDHDLKPIQCDYSKEETSVDEKKKSEWTLFLYVLYFQVNDIFVLIILFLFNFFPERRIEDDEEEEEEEEEEDEDEDDDDDNDEDGGSDAKSVEYKDGEDWVGNGEDCFGFYDNCLLVCLFDFSG